MRKTCKCKRSAGFVVNDCNGPMRGLYFRASTNHRLSCIHTQQTPVLFLWKLWAFLLKITSETVLNDFDHFYNVFIFILDNGNLQTVCNIPPTEGGSSMERSHTVLKLPYCLQLRLEEWHSIFSIAFEVWKLDKTKLVCPARTVWKYRPDG